MYTVMLLNAHPSNNDCEVVMSDEFDCYADAKSAFDNPNELPHGMQVEIRRAKLQGYELWMELDGDEHNQLTQVSKETEKYRRQCEAEARAERQERAMEVGMAFGCAGYNEVMGY